MGNVKTTPSPSTKSDVNSRPTSEENITKPIVLPKPVIRKEETQRWQLSERDIAFLCSQTGFTADEVVSWHKKFFDNNPNGRLDLDNFKKFYCHLQSEPIERLGDMCEHIFRAFDVDGNGVVEFGEFLLGFAICSRGDLRARLDYAFSCYDIGSNGYITEKEISMVMRAMYNFQGVQHVDDYPPDVVARDVMKKLDASNDGRVTRDEFIRVLMKDGFYRNMMNPFN